MFRKIRERRRERLDITERQRGFNYAVKMHGLGKSLEELENEADTGLTFDSGSEKEFDYGILDFIRDKANDLNRSKA